VINKKFCVKIKKAEIYGRLRTQLCPEQVNKIFLFRNSPKF